MTSEFEGSATHPRLTTVGAACAIATVVAFVVGIAFTAASGVGVFAGLGDALSPASSIIEGITFIGFVGFFVWNAAMGVSVLRRA